MVAQMGSGVVFVVDSNAEEAARLAGHVETLGFEAAVFAGTNACLAGLAQREPVALLVSLQLADGRGDECCLRIKENFTWRHLPIIVLTQTEQAHELMYCWRAAATDFLRRPVSIERLKPKLEVIRALAARPEGDRVLAGRWVLLLESSRFYRNTIGGNLEHAGLHVLYAEDTDEALELLDDHGGPIDAALIGLPSLENAVAFAATLAGRRAPPRAVLVLSSAAKVDPALNGKVALLTSQGVVNKRELPFDLVLSRIFSHLKPANVLELRASERMPYFSVVEFSTDDVQWSSGFSYDVSTGGIFVRTLTPPPTGKRVTLKMDFVGQTAISTGVVAWSNPFQPRITFASPVGMGVRLTDAASQLSSQIQGLKRHHPRDGAP